MLFLYASGSLGVTKVNEISDSESLGWGWCPAFHTSSQLFNDSVLGYLCINGEFVQNEDAQLWGQRIDSQGGARPSI